MPRIIHVLAFDNAQVLDVTGPLQVFASANDLARQRGEPLPYAVNVIADQAAPVFMHYVEHQTVPDGCTLRLIADM